MSRQLLLLPRQIQICCPVKGTMYRRSLLRRKIIQKPQAALFFAQWYAFSSSIPEILSIAAMKAASHEERTNILVNLFSEMGLDAGGVSHPDLLKDLIEKATGQSPNAALILEETDQFLYRLKAMMTEGSAAFNAGVMQSLEAVAYQILEVLCEILEKSGNGELQNHPYIVIHEEIEVRHIESTDCNVAMHASESDDIERGKTLMFDEWEIFWNHAFRLLVNSRD